MDRLDAMRVFCAVVDAGGFSRAAERLGMSTSSVTTHVASLESHFRVKLLHRTTRSMSLTGEGSQCYQHALQLLADMQELEARLHDAADTPSGTLRVDMPGLVSRLIVSPALPRFLAQYPDITVRATVSDRWLDMVEEGVDVMIRIGPVADSGLVARQLMQTSFVCCASPDFVRQHGQPASTEALRDFACLGFTLPKARRLRPWVFKDAGEVVPHTRVSSDHADSLLELCKAGAGIGQFLSLSVADALRSGELLPLLEPWQADGPVVHALFQQRQQRAAKVRAFVDFVAELFAARAGIGAPIIPAS
ncbi:LysR family transcriptional regulator [Massilia sp. ST3]|uniref:LysR family transcriptional regulator n=1 Tax=Massilia sp. ST3 TaxID=2824903 RepID=UPI001B817099|nr:LysR family transcriptional regulator [Massilia sp. ST3]MBQ5947865.1 LysR family transcriptional regulator [Massilia sp. ST3]